MDEDEYIGALSIGDAEFVDDLADADEADLADLMDVGAPASLARRQRRARIARRATASRAAAARAVAMRRLVPGVPGVPARGVRLQPLGFPSLAFTSGSGTALTTTARPQRPFKGKRLVVSIARTGATATGLVLVQSLNIGTDNQFVSSGPVPAESFSPQAYDTNLELAPATTAIDITMGFTISAAPTATDRVDLGVALWGEAIGA